MARREYTERDKATVFAFLEGNGGNIKRTARESNIPVSTVRDWKREWEAKGITEAMREVLPAVIEDIADAFESVRNEALLLLQARVKSGDITSSQLVATIGMLTDKLQMIRGNPTKVTEHRVSLPEPNELAALMAGIFQKAVSDVTKRDEEIIEAEWEPADNKALSPAPTQQEA
jgi:transposase-like protein